MIRSTSKKAYKEINESGWVSRKARQVYNKFYESGPMTSAECYNAIPNRGTDQRGNIRARVNELFNMGLLKEIGKRRCSITAKTVIVWDVTNKLPTKKQKPIKEPCPHCKGSGHFIHKQISMDF